ncbi:MAG TPA: CpsB/CapC family capsule biosynthesis tyrosine phosphatase, partial [Solirubrobacteraceae bacterium]
DLHCHILPELDDGARSIGDSVAMARQAADDGIEAVCATPHIRHDHDVHIPEIASRVATLQQALDAEHIPVRILPGGELAQTAAIALTPRELHLISLGGAGGWVLLEPAPGPLGDELTAVVDHLAKLGARPIVAHPERHAGADLRERLSTLVERGCLIQWTAEFVLNASPGDLVLNYARDGLLHLLASDSHSTLAGRPLRLAASYARLADVCSPEQVHWMAEIAPRAIVAGEAVKPPW